MVTFNRFESFMYSSRQFQSHSNRLAGVIDAHVYNIVDDKFKPALPSACEALLCKKKIVRDDAKIGRERR